MFFSRVDLLLQLVRDKGSLPFVKTDWPDQENSSADKDYPVSNLCTDPPHGRGGSVHRLSSQVSLFLARLQVRGFSKTFREG